LQKRKFRLSIATDNMTSEELHQLIIDGENAGLISNYFRSNPEAIVKLVEIAFSENHRLNWRAAWVLDKINDKNPILLDFFIPQIIEFVYSTGNESKLRHFLKIISLHQIPDLQKGKLFDFSFSVFTNPKYAIAVRVHAMQILYEIASSEIDLIPELIQTIENELELHPSAGLESRGKRLLKGLYRKKGYGAS